MNHQSLRIRTGTLLFGVALVAACGDAPGGGSEAPAAPSQVALEIPSPPPAADASLDPILEVLEEKDPFTRAARLASLLPTLDPALAPGVRRLLKSARVDLGPVEAALLLRFWSLHEPEIASDWALAESPDVHRFAAIEIALSHWASIEPLRAAEDVQAFSMMPTPFTPSAQRALVSGWFDSGKPGLPEFIYALGQGFERQRAVSEYSAKLTARDGAAATIAWAESVPDDDVSYKKDVMRQSASSVAVANPLAAAAWCDRVCDRPLTTNMRAMVALRWAEQDGRATMAWIAKSPAGDERDWAVVSAYRAWQRLDTDDLARWFEEMRAADPPEWLEPAVELHAVTLAARGDPHRALEWAALIRDEQARERARVTTAIFWRGLDLAAADAWLEQSPLSEDARERVRNPKLARQRKLEKQAEEEAAEEAMRGETDG